MEPRISPTMARRIELWPVERLVPYAKNARTHSDQQIAQIAASIVEFGFNNPVLVDTDAGIIAGHGRLLAARKLGLDQVPVVVLDHLSETQKRAYILADNRISENAGWDEELLAAELGELQTADWRLDLLGFSEEELTRLLADTDDQKTWPETHIRYLVWFVSGYAITSYFFDANIWRATGVIAYAEILPPESRGK